MARGVVEAQTLPLYRPSWGGVRNHREPECDQCSLWLLIPLSLVPHCQDLFGVERVNGFALTVAGPLPCRTESCLMNLDVVNVLLHFVASLTSKSSHISHYACVLSRSPVVLLCLLLTRSCRPWLLTYRSLPHLDCFNPGPERVRMIKHALEIQEHLWADVRTHSSHIVNYTEVHGQMYRHRTCTD